MGQSNGKQRQSPPELANCNIPSVPTASQANYFQCPATQITYCTNQITSTNIISQNPNAGGTVTADAIQIKFLAK